MESGETIEVASALSSFFFLLSSVFFFSLLSLLSSFLVFLFGPSSFFLLFSLLSLFFFTYWDFFCFNFSLSLWGRFFFHVRCGSGKKRIGKTMMENEGGHRKPKKKEKTEKKIAEEKPATGWRKGRERNYCDIAIPNDIIYRSELTYFSLHPCLLRSPTVTLLAMSEDPPLNARCKDKFLVCSALIPVEKEMVPLAELWNEIQATNKEAIHELKLKCVYLSSSETIPEHSGSAGAGFGGEQSHIMDTTTYDNAIGTPEPSGLKRTTVDRSNSFDRSGNVNAPALTSEPRTTRIDTENVDTRGSGLNLDAVTTTGSTTTDNTTNEKVPATQVNTLSANVKQTVDEQLSAAKAEIERLTSALADQPAVTGLRRRAGQLTGTGSTEDLKKHAQEVAQQVVHTGVPLPTVVLISFAIFLITYLFF